MMPKINLVKNWLLGAVAALAATGGAAVQAQTCPQREIRLVVPYSAGAGAADHMGRTLAQKLNETLGWSVFVENRAGADALIGTASVANAKPDGRTILFGDSSALTLSPAIRKVNFNPRDFVVIGPAATLPYVFVVSTKLGVKSLADFVTLAKSAPGTLNYASSSSMTEFGMELLKAQTGTDVVKISYPGAAQGITSILAGQTSMYFLPPLVAKPYINSGQMIALATATPARLPIFPDVPTFAELGYPGIDVQMRTGLFAPKGTPDAVVVCLNQALTQIMADPQVQSKFENDGVLINRGQNVEDFTKALETDREKWKRVASEAGLGDAAEVSSK
jgi:tripartite-type tricarboxylate transporter receptor subunit TctC